MIFIKKKHKKMNMLSVNYKCVSKQETENLSTVIFGFEISDSDKGMIAKKIFSYQTMNAKEVQPFEIGKTYEISISEKPVA